MEYFQFSGKGLYTATKGNKVLYQSVTVKEKLKFPSELLIIIIIIIILVINFMQGIFNYKAETNNISGVYSVVAVLYRQFVLHVMLFRPCNLFYTLTLALSIYYYYYYYYYYFHYYITVGGVATEFPLAQYR